MKSSPQAEAPAPVAPGVCLDCRSVVAAGGPCPGGPRHRVTTLDSPLGRERLISEVWGPPHLRRTIRQAALAGGSGGAGSALLESTCGLAECVGGADGAAALVIAVGVLLGLLVYLGLRALRSWYERHRNRPVPKGAWVEPVTPGPIRAGVVMAPKEAVRADARLARGVRLECRRVFGSSVMLRDGICQGLTVELEQGGRVRIPPGRLPVEGPTALARVLTATELREYLETVDPLRAQAGPDEPDPFPGERALEISIKAGDRVEICGQLDWEADPEGRGGGYRSPAASLGVPRGPCSLRLVSPG